MRSTAQTIFTRAVVCLLGFAFHIASSIADEPCTVSIVVLDKTSRSPMSSVEVALRYRPPGRSVFYTGREQDQESIGKGLTGQTGTIFWDGLSPGRDYYVVARAPGFDSTFLSVKCGNESAHPTEIVLDRPIDVSLIQLIADPSPWHDRFVRVIGFLEVEFEGTALYVNKEDWEVGDSKNGIWVDFSLSDLGKYKSLGRHVVIMEGVLDATSYGHMGMFSGSLTKITRCERWRWAR